MVILGLSILTPSRGRRAPAPCYGGQRPSWAAAPTPAAPAVTCSPSPPQTLFPSLSRRPSVILPTPLPVLPTQSVLNYLLRHFSRNLPRPYVKGASRGLSSEVRSHCGWAPVPTPAGQLGRSTSVLSPLRLPLPQGSQRTPAGPPAFSTAHLKDPPKTDDNSSLNSLFFDLPGHF